MTLLLGSSLHTKVLLRAYHWSEGLAPCIGDLSVRKVYYWAEDHSQRNPGCQSRRQVPDGWTNTELPIAKGQKA